MAAPTAASDCLTDIDVVILAGGLGTRLRPVLDDRPKVLAPIGTRTYLDYLLDWLAGFGARRIVLALGHMAERVTEHLAAHPRAGLVVVERIEPEPMGTAGAIRFARAGIQSEAALVLNGDTFVDADLCDFVTAHRVGGAEATLLCASVPNAGRYGTVEIDPQGRIERFVEKTGRAAPGTISAGVYMMGRAMLDRIDATDGRSLELDVFQAMPPGSLAAHVGEFAFLDIGVPEDLARAETFLATLGRSV